MSKLPLRLFISLLNYMGLVSCDSLSYILYRCSDEPLTVQLPGTQTRSFCYVSDMVRSSFILFWLFNWKCIITDFDCIVFLGYKVDGLIRLMEGDNMGPINVGNPGSYQNSIVDLSLRNKNYDTYLFISISYFVRTKKETRNLKV